MCIREQKQKQRALGFSEVLDLVLNVDGDRLGMTVDRWGSPM